MGNWERLVWNQRDALIAGFAVTVEVCVIAFLAAIVGGLVLCLVRLYVAPLRPIAIVLIEFFRDTPIFVQLMWVSYVWPELFGFPSSFFSAGWIALGLQSSGYLAETFRTGIEGVPRGQREAAFSAGMSPAQTFSLAAKKGLGWDNTDTVHTCPLTTDITKLFFTNAGASDVTVVGGFLLNI